MPRFPFRRSPGQDLRDLFAHDRIASQTNDLGYSSISPGEGLLEIRDAAGAAIAGMGHEAGKSGFLVRRGGAWVTLQEHVDAEVAAGTAGVADRLDDHARRIGAAEGRLGTAEGRLDSHASRIGAAEGVNTTQNGRLDSHASRLGRHENDMEAIDGKLVSAFNALESRVAQLEGKSGNPINPTPIVKG